MTTATAAKKSKAATAAPISTAAVVLDEKAIGKEVHSIQETAAVIVVKDQESFNAAGAIRKQISAFIKKHEDSFFTKQYKLMKELKDGIDGLWDRYITPAQKLDKSLKISMESWYSAENRRKQVEAQEKQRLADLEAERQRKALEKKAATAEKKGNEEKADALRKQAATVAPVQVAVEKAVDTSGTGTAVRTDIEVEITDIRAFLKFACDDINVDMQALVTLKAAEAKKMAKRYREMKLEIPGAIIKGKVIVSS
jgi:hypothetical protein